MKLLTSQKLSGQKRRCQADRTHRQRAAVPHRHGSMQRRPSLGTRIYQVRPYRAPDGAQVCGPLPHERQARQERCGRCCGIAEAVTRPNMRFVPLKTIEQQSRLFVHRARQGYVEQRTALINRIRGLLSELGIVLPLKAATVRREAHKHLEDLPGWCNTVVGDALSELTHLDDASPNTTSTSPRPPPRTSSRANSCNSAASAPPRPAPS